MLVESTGRASTSPLTMPSMRYVCAHTSGICPAGVTAISTKPSRHCGTRTQGPAPPRLAAQGTPPHPAQTPARTGQGRVETLGVLASHSRIPEITELARKIRRRRPDILRTIELGYSNARLEASDNRIKVTIACLRLPPRRQPHRPDHAPMRWTRHPTTTTHDLTHESSRSL